MSELVIWSVGRGEWVSRPDHEITWLDRTLLSADRDRSLHRSPRCPALRYVHYRWELFSRDTTHSVYVASYIAGDSPDYQAVASAARYVLPTAKVGLETQPIRLDAGAWAISVGKWILPVCIDVTLESRDNPTVPHDEGLPATYDIDRADVLAGLETPPAPDAVARVASYLQRNPVAGLAMAYYYQDFIRGEFAPHAVPMVDVVIALDLTNEGTVSEYKKELQRRIWNEQGHQRELGKFLLVNNFISLADLTQALQMAAENEASGRTRLAKERLRYKTRK